MHTAGGYDFQLSDGVPMQSSCQGGSGEGGQVHPGHSVLHGQKEAAGQIVAGDHLALFLGFFQKIPGPAGSGGVVQIKDADDRLLPDGHIAADGKVHISSSSYISPRTGGR